jgi:hypothetical protein
MLPTATPRPRMVRLDRIGRRVRFFRMNERKYS